MIMSRSTISAFAFIVSSMAAATSYASPAQEQACAGEASQIRNVPMSAVRVGHVAHWADGSAAIKLKVGHAQAACWVSRRGEVQLVSFGKGVPMHQEQACAGEASQIRDVPMSAVRSKWAFSGPDGTAWVRLKVDGKAADCRVSGSGEVLEVGF